MPTIIEALDRPDIALAFFIRISGIPYIFSNIPQPSQWTETDGQTIFGVDASDVDRYGWSQTLLLDGIGSVGQRAEPKAGLGTSTQQNFSVLLRGLEAQDPAQGLWLSYLIRDPVRADLPSSILTNDLPPDETGGGAVIELRDASDFPLEETNVFVGIETIKAGGVGNTATELDGIGKRGAFGSWETYHRVSTDQTREDTAGGAYVTTWPVTWRGRVVDLRMCHGRFKAGVWEPFGSDASTGSVGVYSGIVTAVREGDDTLTASIQTASLDQLLNRKVAGRLPRARVLTSPTVEEAMSRIQVGPHNHWIHFQWTPISATAAEGLRAFNQQLLDPFSGPVVALADGLYSLDTIARSISRTINEAWPSVPSWEVQIWPGISGNGKEARIDFEMFAPSDLAKVGKNYVLDMWAFGPDGRRLSILAYLGWKDACRFEVDEVATAVSTGTKWAVTSSNTAPPSFIWPSRSQGLPEKLYIWRQSGPGFVLNPGWRDDNGNNVPGCIQIGGFEIVEITGTGTTQMIAGTDSASYDYLDLDSARGVFNSGLEEPAIIAFDPNADKSIEVKQVIALPNVNFVRAFLYLFNGGSGVNDTLDPLYDKGWLGSGAALPSRLVDTAGMLSVAGTIHSARDQIAITAETTLREWITDELILSQVLLMPQSDFAGDVAYRLRLVEHGPQMAHEADTSHVLDLTKTATFRGKKIGFDRDEGLIISKVEIKAGFDVVKQKSMLTLNNTEMTSLETWGGDTLKLTAKSIGQAADDERTGRLLAQAIFNRYARPYAVIGLSCTHPSIWTWNVGDWVVITNPAIPKLGAPGRGVVALPARIMRKKDEFIPTGETCSRLEMVANIQSDRYGAWAPSLLLIATGDGGTTWTVADHEFSDPDSDPYDLTYFSVGDIIFGARRGVAGITIRSIVAITPSTGSDDGTVEVSVPLTGLFWVLSFASYSTILDSQKVYAFWSNGSGFLAPGETSYRYF